MRRNYNSQTQTYGGQLIFPATTSFPTLVTIPLYIKTSDIPVRKPKVSEINTIPMHDEAGVSDWSTHVMFYGGQGLLQTSITGFMLTPTTPVQDGLTGQIYQQLSPLADGSLLGYSYGDIIWAYLQGKMNQLSTNTFIRTDPSSYTDPFGNVYNSPIIQQFECDYSVSIAKQTFNLTMYLEV